MASKAGHLATGAASGVIASLISYKLLSSQPLYLYILTFLASIPGGTAPDWLEITSWSPETGRQSLIKHRTITHWGLLWLFLWFFSLLCIPVIVWATIFFGFATGGLMHLLMDWPNPMGVPWIRIKKRHSLNLWRSGEYEFLLVIVVWAIVSFIAYVFWWYPKYANVSIFSIFNWHSIRHDVWNLMLQISNWWSTKNLGLMN